MLPGRLPGHKEEILMKNSTFAAILMFLAAAVGGLVAAALDRKSVM